MKIYKRGKKTFVNGEHDLVITDKYYGMKWDRRFMKNHTIKHFFVVGCGRNLREKLIALKIAIRWILTHKQQIKGGGK